MLPNRKFQPARGAQQDENAMPAPTAAKKGMPPANAAFNLPIKPSITKPISLPIKPTAAVPAKPATRRGPAQGVAVARPIGPAPAIPAAAPTAMTKLENPRKRASDRELKYAPTAVPAAVAAPALPQHPGPAAKRVRPNSRKAQQAAAAAVAQVQKLPEAPVAAPRVAVRALDPQSTNELKRAVRSKRIALLDPGMDEPNIDADDEVPDQGAYAAEYAGEILDYLMLREKDFMPNPTYAQDRADVSWSLRAEAVDYVMRVHLQLALTQETLHLAVNLLDRFLSRHHVGAGKMQCACLAVLLMAAKIEEMTCPDIGTMLAFVSGVPMTTDQLVHAEQVVLRTLDYDVWAPGPCSFLRRVSTADGFDYDHRLGAKILLDAALYDYRLLAFPPSQVAAASLRLARQVVSGADDWDAIYRYASAYHADELQPVVDLLIEGVCDMEYGVESELQGFLSKYVTAPSEDAAAREPKGTRKARRMAHFILDRTRQRWGAEVRARRAAAAAAGIMALAAGAGSTR
ncbi:hypothetical protein GGF32_005631 [Allomyces javanicus]|nr:hypothetical protein GGF32_005631 [Allomyces javanicus]